MDPVSFLVALQIALGSAEKNQEVTDLQECANFSGVYHLENHDTTLKTITQDEKSIQFSENYYAYKTTMGFHEVKNELGETIKYNVTCLGNKMTLEFIRYIGTRKDYAALMFFKTRQGFVLKTSTGERQKWLTVQKK